MNELAYYIPAVLNTIIWIGLLVFCIVAQSRVKQKGWGMMIAFAGGNVVLHFVHPILYKFVYPMLDFGGSEYLIMNILSFLLNLIPITFLFIALYQFYQGHVNAKKAQL